jgi:UDP:flavonoid glycosyltransferase YjiC (YdhE family)
LTKNTRLVKNFLKILVCPLDWGIGHATRCVPVIRHLLRQKHEVIIAADGRPLDFLREYFPDLEYVRLPGFKVSYPSGNNMIAKMMFQSPYILFNTYKEHQHLKKIIRDHKADAVISDNRFGLWSKKVYSVYMTHQVMIKAPGKMRWVEPLAYRWHNWFIKHYDECWIPDLPGEMNLSGDLGHKYPLPVNGHYVGILSRFEEFADHPEPVDRNTAPDLLIMLSGPEPQRSILEKIMLNELGRHRGLHAVVLQGLPGKPYEYSPQSGVVLVNHLPDKDISRLISSSRMIICRPGYSTIMDLATLGRNAVLIPTPGQTEQEYLAGYLQANGAFSRMEQEGFDLGLALQAGKQLKEPSKIKNDRSLLAERINEFRKKNLTI